MWMKNVSTYDAICKQISAHEHNYRLKKDESPNRSTHMAHGCIYDIFEQKWKRRKRIHNPKHTHSAFK